MTHEEATGLLERARTVLERYLFESDGAVIRDDVAELCAAIDDVLPPSQASHSEARELARTAA
jgi:hypothetical protein